MQYGINIQTIKDIDNYNNIEDLAALINCLDLVINIENTNADLASALGQKTWVMVAKHGVVEWHPHRPMIVACGLESGRINIWSIIPQQRWSALAPDFVEVEENVEYIEHEDEFDIHPQEEIHKRRLDAEDDDIDVLTVEPVKGSILEEENAFKMPVQLDLMDSESEEEFVAVGRDFASARSASSSRRLR